MKPELAAMRQLQLARAAWPEPWKHVVDGEIYVDNEDKAYIGRLKEPAQAEYICQLHNIFGLLANITWMLYQRRIDQVRMDREQQNG